MTGLVVRRRGQRAVLFAPAPVGLALEVRAVATGAVLGIEGTAPRHLPGIAGIGAGRRRGWGHQALQRLAETGENRVRLGRYVRIDGLADGIAGAHREDAEHDEGEDEKVFLLHRRSASLR